MSNDATRFKNRIRLEEESTASTAKGELRVDSNGDLFIHDGSEERKVPNDSQLADFDDAPAGAVVGTTDAQTLTNKTIDANNNTISNLAHGAEVDDPSSGVHGVTGDIVGTTDSQTLTNKTLTSPVLNTSVSGTAVLDEDDMTSDSDTQLATQQSIKAYADTKIAQSVVDAKGDIIVATADNTVTRLAVGSNDQVLTADSGEASGVKWAAVPTGDLAVNNYSSAQTLTTANQFVTADASSAAFTITLYAASGNTGKQLTIKKTDSTFNVVTIDGNASETIDGSTTIKLCTQNEQVTLVCDGTNWQIASRSWDSAANSYTPGVQGAGTVSSVEFEWQRVAIDAIEIRGRFNCGTVNANQAEVDLPSGLTIATTNGSRELLGNYIISSSTGGANKFGPVIGDDNDPDMFFGRGNYSVGISPFTPQAGNACWETSQTVGINFRCKITQWEQ